MQASCYNAAAEITSAMPSDGFLLQDLEVYTEQAVDMNTKLHVWPIQYVDYIK